MLMNNGYKLEALLIGTRQQLAKIDFTSITIGDGEVKISHQIRTHGVTFDTNFHLASQMDSLCRTVFLQLNNLRTIQQ